MKIILVMITVAGICVTVGGLGLHFQNKKRLDELERLIGYLNTDNGSIKKRVGVIEERDRQAANKVEIVHKYDDSEAPEYGGF